MLNSKDISKKSESESITFRIGKPILDDLRQEAKNALKSINTLVNQVIKTYVIWHKHAKKAGYIYFDNTLVSIALNHLSDKQITQIAEEYYKRRSKEVAFMLNGENSLSSFIDGTLRWLDASGFNYKYNNNDVSKTLIIRFNMGKKWSLYFKTYI